MTWNKSSSAAWTAVICFAAACAVSAQSPPGAPKFEVASVRLTSPLDQAAGVPGAGAKVTFSGARLNVDGLVLRAAIAEAWGLPMYRVIGADWTSLARVVIHAVMPEGATKEQVPAMLKALFEERFHLVAHLTNNVQPAYALVLGKKALKLSPPREIDSSACAEWIDELSFSGGQRCNTSRQMGEGIAITLVKTAGETGPARMEITNGNTHTEYFRITMQQLAQLLSIPGGRGSPGLPVVDRTGIAGARDIVLDRNCLDADCETDADALEKIGLKLEKTNAPIEQLVIDQIDKVPTEN